MDGRTDRQIASLLKTKLSFEIILSACNVELRLLFAINIL